MTTEAENDCHWIGYGKPASPCGLPFPETLGRRWTNVRKDVTCPACLTAMGEPADAPEVRQRAIAAEVMAERKRQAAKFPASERGLPDGTGASGYKTYRDIARHSCDRADREGRVTMAHIFEEEALEVLAEEEPTKLRVELVQVAAVCMKWIEELDRREPRVISGLDTAAATPERTCPKCEWAESDCACGAKAAPPPPVRPSRVEVGHAWRVGSKLGRTLYRDGECVGIVDTPELAEQIVAALGIVPAPVSAPAAPPGPANAAIPTHVTSENRDCVPWCSGCSWRRSRNLSPDWEPKPDVASGQSTPVETPPTEPKEPAMDTDSVPNTPMARAILEALVDSRAGRNYYDDTRMLLRVLEPFVAPAPPGPVEPRRCRFPLVSGGLCQRLFFHEGEHSLAPDVALAAPAPGVGEGLRELTFAEACKELDDRKAVEVCFNSNSDSDWTLVSADFDGKWNWNTLARWGTYRYRLKPPEPLPAPAPRVSRVSEMAEEWGHILGVIGDVSEATVLAYRVVGAVASFVRERGEEALAVALEREFLEPR